MQPKIFMDDFMKEFHFGALILPDSIIGLAQCNSGMIQNDRYR